MNVADEIICHCYLILVNESLRTGEGRNGISGDSRGVAVLKYSHFVMTLRSAQRRFNYRALVYCPSSRQARNARLDASSPRTAAWPLDFRFTAMT